MQSWSAQGAHQKEDRERLTAKALTTDLSPKALAVVFGCEAATEVDPELLEQLYNRQYIYGDICQNMTRDLYSGNNIPLATEITKLKADAEGTRRVQAPAFYEDGNTLVKPHAQVLKDDLSMIKQLHDGGARI